MRFWPAAAVIVLLWLVFSALILVEQNRQEMSGVKSRPLVAANISEETVTLTCFDGKVEIARPEVPGWDEICQVFKNARIFKPY